MRPETQAIWKLVAKLIGTQQGPLTTNVTKGKQPKPIADKVASYRRGGFASPLWTNADSDIVAMIAMADIMWENRIQPFAKKDEADLQIALGANALSKADTEAALRRMRQEQSELPQFRTQCEALPPLALAVVGKSTMLGPANASQIGFDKLGADEVRKRCDRNKQHINEILGKLNRVIPATEEVLRAHAR